MRKRVHKKDRNFLLIAILIGSFTLATALWAQQSPYLSPSLSTEHSTTTTDVTGTFTCTDTDGDLNLKSIYRKGIVALEQKAGFLGGKKRVGGGVDRCLGENRIVEYSCNEKGRVLSLLITCPEGYTCNNELGACV